MELVFSENRYISVEGERGDGEGSFERPYRSEFLPLRTHEKSAWNF
jgi:hypothetical protein